MWVLTEINATPELKKKQNKTITPQTTGGFSLFKGSAHSHILWSVLSIIKLACFVLLSLWFVQFFVWNHQEPGYLFTPVTSLLTHSLFSNMLVSLHVFGCFSVFFLWFISSFIALWSEKMFDMISVFLNFLRHVLCPNMWSILKLFHVHLKIMYILFWGEMLWRYQWNPFDLVCCLRLPSSCWFSVWKICPLQSMGIKIPNYDYITVDLSLYIHQDLLCIFRCAYFGCINVYKAYILLLDFSIIM